MVSRGIPMSVHSCSVHNLPVFFHGKYVIEAREGSTLASNHDKVSSCKKQTIMKHTKALNKEPRDSKPIIMGCLITSVPLFPLAFCTVSMPLVVVIVVVVVTAIPLSPLSFSSDDSSSFFFPRRTLCFFVWRAFVASSAGPIHSTCRSAAVDLTNM